MFFSHGSLPWESGVFTVIQATTGGFDWEDALRLVGQAGQGERVFAPKNINKGNSKQSQQQQQESPKIFQKTPTDNNEKQTTQQQIDTYGLHVTTFIRFCCWASFLGNDFKSLTLGGNCSGRVVSCIEDVQLSCDLEMAAYTFP